MMGDDGMLFDRQKDPEQVDNLFFKPEYKEVIAELTQRIIQNHTKYDSPAIKWLKK